MPTAVEAHPSFKFSVEINNKAVACTEVTLPPLQFDTEKIYDGGNNDYVHTLPKGVQTGTITLKRASDQSGTLMQWYFELLGLKQLKQADKTITIVMYAVDGSEVMRLSFHHCTVQKWQGPALNASQSTVAVDEIQVNYHAVSTP